MSSSSTSCAAALAVRGANKENIPPSVLATDTSTTPPPSPPRKKEKKRFAPYASLSKAGRRTALSSGASGARNARRRAAGLWSERETQASTDADANADLADVVASNAMVFFDDLEALVIQARMKELTESPLADATDAFCPLFPTAIPIA